MKKEFYSNGKLLITGEYLVLDGAKSLALPTKFGQSLSVEITNNPCKIFWRSFDSDGDCWFETELDFNSIMSFKYDSKLDSVQNTLIRILKEGFQLNPEFLQDKTIGYHITTNLNFPRNWGLGTSSTLLNNIAQWLQIDAFVLLHASFGGSGYDIACAQNNAAITYQLKNSNPMVEKVSFNPSFTDSIYFLYLNKKQNSKSAIATYRNKKLDLDKKLEEVTSITDYLLKSPLTLKQFKMKLIEHEKLLSTILEVPTIQQTYFQDFDGVVKSLGAWGGDFVMVVSSQNPKRYFASKGFEVLLSFEEMILNN
jgi:mevalonate kinase